MQKNSKAHWSIIVAMSLFLSLNLVESTSSAVLDKILVQEVSEQFETEIQCLAENVYYEAASESYEGKLAVAQVTMNRANNAQYPKTVCGVVKQRDNRTCQFTWVCENKHTIRNKYEWEASQVVARKAMTEVSVHDVLYQSQAIYYHADYVNPGWNKKRVTKIGRHIFYK